MSVSRHVVCLTANTKLNALASGTSLTSVFMVSQAQRTIIGLTRFYFSVYLINFINILKRGWMDVIFVFDIQT